MRNILPMGVARVIWCCDLTKGQIRYHTDTGRLRDITAPMDNPPIRTRPTQGAQDEHTLSTDLVKMAFECDGPSGCQRLLRLFPNYCIFGDSSHRERYVCKNFLSEELFYGIISRK